MRPLILAALLALAVPAAADAPVPRERPALAVVVTDGDTIRVGRERIRLMGLDAPEIRGRCAAERRLARRAAAHLATLLADGATLERRGVDRYGRTLAIVRVRGRDVAPMMIAAGLARPYAGGRRQGWCG